MLQCTQPFDHEHSIGTIDYCKTCHWKRILTNAGELIHTTPVCKCLNDNQSSTNIEICKKTSSLSYSCKSCLVSQKCLVRHIYVYPNIANTTIILSMPVQLKKKKSIPFVHNELQCKMCYKKNYDCNTIGYVWMCYSCRKKQLRLLTTPKEYICINDKAQTNSYDSVVWFCSKCSLLNLSYFNDSS